MNGVERKYLNKVRDDILYEQRQTYREIGEVKIWIKQHEETNKMLIAKYDKDANDRNIRITKIYSKLDRLPCKDHVTKIKIMWGAFWIGICVMITYFVKIKFLG